MDKQTKNICSLNQNDKSDVDPPIDLQIEGYHVRQVFLDFGSQVNIMTRDSWEERCIKIKANRQAEKNFTPIRHYQENMPLDPDTETREKRAIQSH